MPSLFDAVDLDAILARLRGLRPDAARRWGTMDVAQMLVHCQASVRLASGETRLPRVLIGRLFGRLAKRSITSPKEWKRGLPTANEFKVRGPREFAVERDRLVDLVTRLSRGGPAGLTSAPHPFFGTLTPTEWDVLTTRHLDHHLRQFGA